MIKAKRMIEEKEEELWRNKHYQPKKCKQHSVLVQPDHGPLPIFLPTQNQETEYVLENISTRWIL